MMADKQADFATLIRSTSLRQITEFIGEERHLALSAPVPAAMLTVALSHPHALLYYALAIWDACRKHHRRLLLVAQDETAAAVHARSLIRAGVPCRYLPPLKDESDDGGDIGSIGDIAAERVRAWYGYQLAEQEALLLCSASSFVTPIVAPAAMHTHTITLTRGASCPRDQLAKRLPLIGYRRVQNLPAAVGEYAIRGEVIDIHPLGEPTPLRVHTEFDIITHIEPLIVVDDTTRAVGDEHTKIDALPDGGGERIGFTILPFSEWPLKSRQLSTNQYTTPQRSLAKDQVCCMFYYTASDQGNSVYESIQQYPAKGVYKSIQLPSLAETQAGWTVHFRHSADIDDLVPPPTLSELRASPKYYNNLQLAESECGNYRENGYTLYAMRGLTPLLATEPELAALLTPLSLSLPHGILFAKAKAIAYSVSDFFVAADGAGTEELSMSEALLGSGVESLATLEVGDYVTHARHGIGKYLGLEQMTVNHKKRDYFAVQYAEEMKIFVPPEQLHLLHRYRALSDHEPQLDRVGGAAWQRRRAAARERTDRYAVQLLRLYARRNAQQGIAFADDGEWQQLLQQGFAFTETAAQIRCLEEIFADMERARPMNRLLCGDAGNGKTEVALRAAVKCVYSAHQVVLLAPTTVLAEQHHETLVSRLSTLPIAVALFTRMTSTVERSRLLAGIAAGTIDIVIATHRLLYEQEAVFQQLGLLIIDEEHRFGVRAKEKIKALNTSVDYLAISATPIPRSLQFALSQLHDISFLDEAPRNRKPIITKLHAYDRTRIAEAIRFEMRRGGQIYYLHNSIATLPHKQSEISELFPDLRITAIHGKMKADRIEDELHAFIHRQYDLLLSTTIIENGIDIPNVNTIIVEGADAFGISNLYQLRGRVGRSAAQSYAHLFYNPDRYKKNPKVKRRLEIIGDATHYSSGLSIALEDLEMRGAGNVLGREQSGDISSIGYEAYIKMLDSSIRAIAQDGEEQRPDPYLQLEYEGYLPDDYIPAMAGKLAIYQRVALANSDDDITTLRRRLISEYGELPLTVETLLSVAMIRLLAEQLWITQIRQMDDERFQMRVEKIARLNQNRLLALIDQKRLILPNEQRANIVIHIPTTGKQSVYHQLCVLLRTLQPA